MGKIEHIKWMLLRSRMTRQMEARGCSTVLVYILCVIILLLTGCKSIEYVPVEKVVKEYVTKHDTIMEKDSVWLHDSVYIHAVGDTIWYERWRTKYVDKWREKIVVDSFIKVDSIPVPYKVEVEKKLTFWQNTKQNLGGYALVICLGALIYIFARFYLRR